MRLAFDPSGVDQALIVLDGRRLLAADDWVRVRADPPVLVRLDAVVKRAGGKPDDLDAVVAARGPGSVTGAAAPPPLPAVLRRHPPDPRPPSHRRSGHRGIARRGPPRGLCLAGRG